MTTPLRKYINRIRGIQNKYRVKSRTNPTKFYVVEMLKNGETKCECLSSQYGRDCFHQQKVKRFLHK